MRSFISISRSGEKIIISGDKSLIINLYNGGLVYPYFYLNTNMVILDQMIIQNHLIFSSIFKYILPSLVRIKP